MKKGFIKRIIPLIISSLIIIGVFQFHRSFSNFISPQELENPEIFRCLSMDYVNFVRYYNRDPRNIDELIGTKWEYDTVLYTYIKKSAQLIRIEDSLYLVRTPFETSDLVEHVVHAQNSKYSIFDYIINKPFVQFSWPHLKMPCDFDYIFDSRVYFYAMPNKLNFDSTFRKSVREIIHNSFFSDSRKSLIHSFPSYRDKYIITMISTPNGYKAMYDCQPDSLIYSKEVLSDIEVALDSADITSFDTVYTSYHHFIEE